MGHPDARVEQTLTELGAPHSARIGAERLFSSWEEMAEFFVTVVTYWDRNAPADYAVEFKSTLFPTREFYPTIATAKMLGEAVEAGASAEYLTRGMRMKLKPADIIRRAREGVPFEYLTAYYENETL